VGLIGSTCNALPRGREPAPQRLCHGVHHTLAFILALADFFLQLLELQIDSPVFLVSGTQRILRHVCSAPLRAPLVACFPQLPLEGPGADDARHVTDTRCEPSSLEFNNIL